MYKRHGDIIRHPHTTQELRFNGRDEKFIRGKRRHLPNVYDDIIRSDFYIKHSWKKQKKRKQWL